MKYFLRQEGQLQKPPMRLLTDAEVLEHLWSGKASVAKRLVRAAAGALANDAPVVRRAAALAVDRCEGGAGGAH